MQNHRTIEAAATAIANQLSANIPLREIIHRMPKLQPQYAPFWIHAHELLRHGHRLSDAFEQAKNTPNAWPDPFVSAIKAGEASDSLQPVFAQIAASSQISQQIAKTYSKLISPFSAFLLGLAMFLFYMIGVIPNLQTNLGGKPDAVLSFALWLKATSTSYWHIITIALISSTLALIAWLKQPPSRQILLRWASSIPQLNQAFKNIYFAQWAFQLAILDASGLPPKQQVQLSYKTLPDIWHPSALAFASDIEKKGLNAACDPEKLPPNDPRASWPFYISTAFQIAFETGKIHQEMRQIAPLMLADGLRQLSAAITVADAFAKLSAAIMIGVPLLAYFNQMANSLTAAFK